MEPNRPKVGVGILIQKDAKILLGKRRNAHGEGSWAAPGGHLEFGESWEECAIREVQEECGIEIQNIRFGTATNDLFPSEQKHYITIAMLADWKSGEPKILEPHKCEEWGWFEWNTLPQPLFIPMQNLLAMHFQPFSALHG